MTRMASHLSPASWLVRRIHHHNHSAGHLFFGCYQGATLLCRCRGIRAVHAAGPQMTHHLGTLVRKSEAPGCFRAPLACGTTAAHLSPCRARRRAHIGTTRATCGRFVSHLGPSHQLDVQLAAWHSLHFGPVFESARDVPICSDLPAFKVTHMSRLMKQKLLAFDGSMPLAGIPVAHHSHATGLTREVWTWRIFIGVGGRTTRFIWCEKPA